MKNKKIVKIKENELFLLLEEQLTHPEKYDKRVNLIKELKDSKFYLNKSIDKLKEAYRDAETLPDEEIGITSAINKCFTKLKKESTEISQIIDSVSEGDLQPKQDELEKGPEPEISQ